MIAKLNSNEQAYEKTKTLLRRHFIFGTVPTSGWNKLDKGKFMKEFICTEEPDSSWTLYLHKKLSWITQNHKNQYKWCFDVDRCLRKNLTTFIKRRERLWKEFSPELSKSKSACGSRKALWKGIETASSNIGKFNNLKDQFKSSSHPLNKLVFCFQKWVISEYNFLIYPKSIEVNFLQVKKTLIDEVQTFIAILFFTTVKFYNLTFKDNENNSDILLEILTERVLKGELYMAIYNIISYCLQDEIMMLNDEMVQEEKVDFDNSRFIAGISEIFSFSQSRKEKILSKSSISPTIANEDSRLDFVTENENTKYEKWIKMIWSLKNIENPTDKILLLVKVVNQMKNEIDLFWQGVDIDSDQKCIDADNMEKLLSYVIIKSKYQKIVVDLEIIDHFGGNHIDYGSNGFIFVSFSSTVNQILFKNKNTMKSQALWTTPSFKPKFNKNYSENSLDENEEKQNTTNLSFVNLSPMSPESSDISHVDIL